MLTNFNQNRGRRVMRRKSIAFVTVVAFTFAVVFTGCQTTGQSSAAGAVVGGLLGGVIGNQSGHAAEGAAIGAVLGAGVGAIVGEVKKESRQVRTASETKQQHEDWSPNQGLQLELEESTISPQRVRPGDEVVAHLRYVALGVPETGIAIHERQILETPQGATVKLNEEELERTEGTWESDLTFLVAQKATPGKYTLKQSVAASGSQAMGQNEFDVTELTAELTIIVEESAELLTARR